MNVQEFETASPEPAIEPLLQLLIDQQGVKPVTDLDDLAALWPADDDPNDLLAFILAERNERQLAAAQKDEGR